MGDLRKLASRELYSVRGDRVTRELLRDSAGDSTTHALADKSTSGAIDFFVSHSWHDDAEQKFEALQCLMAEFKREHKRWPTLWLDKVCINQSKITETLRCLPIFLVSCRRMLVLAGETYVTRLWCIWELHMLYAAAGTEAP